MGKVTRKVPAGQANELPDFDNLMNAPEGAATELPDFDAALNGEKKNPSLDASATGSVSAGAPAGSPSTSPSAGDGAAFAESLRNFKPLTGGKKVAAVVPAVKEPTPAERKKQAVDFVRQDYLANKLSVDRALSVDKDHPFGQDVGFLNSHFLDDLSSDDGSTVTLERYRKQRLFEMEEGHKAAVEGLESKYPSQLLPMHTAKPTYVRDDEEGYEREKGAIDKNFNDVKQKLTDAVFLLGAVKQYKEARKNAGDIDRANGSFLDEKKFGHRLREITGDPSVDEEKMDEVQGIPVSAKAKAANARTGLAAMETALGQMAGEYTEKGGAAPDWIVKEAGAVLQKRAAFPAAHAAYYHEQKIAALSNEIAKKKGGWKMFTDWGTSQDDINEAAKGLGWNEGDVKDIKPEEIHSQNAIGALVDPIVKSGADLGSLLITRPLRQLQGQNQRFIDRTEDQAIEDYRGLFSTAPEENSLFRPGTVLDTNKNSATFLQDVANNKAGSVNLSARNIINTISGGLGQVIKFSAGGEAKAGQFAFMALDGYLDHYKQAKDMGIEGDGEANAYAAIRSLSNAFVFSSLNIPGIGKNLLGTTESAAGKSFADLMAKKGLDGVTAAALKPVVKTAIIETAKETGKMIALGEADLGADLITTSLFKPEALENRHPVQEAMQSAVVMAMGTIVPAGLGAYRKAAAESSVLKNMVWEMGSKPEDYMNAVWMAYKQGHIGEADARDKMTAIAEMTKAVHMTPDYSMHSDAQLSAEQKADYATNLTREAVLRKKLDAVKGDDVQEKAITEEMARLKTGREEILRSAKGEGAISVTGGAKGTEAPTDEAPPAGQEPAGPKEPGGAPAAGEEAMEQMDLKTFSNLKPGDRVYADYADGITGDVVESVNPETGTVTLAKTGVKTQTSLDSEAFGQRLYHVPKTEAAEKTDDEKPTDKEKPVEEDGSAAASEATPAAGDVSTGGAGDGAADEKAVTTFKTSKGSTYDVQTDGSTIRNKAARPEHPGEEGVQPKSDKTYYVTKEDLDKLSVLQTEGWKDGERPTLKEDKGHIAVVMEGGKNDGKFLKGTVVKPQEGPAAGLYPVETWDNGRSHHFGNEITEVAEKEKGKVETSPVPKMLQTAPIETGEGSGDEVVRGHKIPKNPVKARSEFIAAVESGTAVPTELREAVATDPDAALDRLQQEATGHDSNWNPLPDVPDNARQAAEAKYGKEIVDRAMGLLTKKKIRAIDQENRQRLRRDPESFEEAVLQHFAFGGRVNLDDFKRMTGFGTKIERGPNAGKTNGNAELKKFIWAVGKEGIKPDQWISDDLSQRFGIDKGDEFDHHNQLYDILQSHPTRTAMLDRLREIQQDGALENRFGSMEPEVALHEVVSDDDAHEIVEAGLQDEAEQAIVGIDELVDGLSDEQLDVLSTELAKYEHFLSDDGAFDDAAIRKGLEPFGELWGKLLDAGVNEDLIENLTKYSENDYKQIATRQDGRGQEPAPGRKEETGQSADQANAPEQERSGPPAAETVVPAAPVPGGDSRPLQAGMENPSLAGPAPAITPEYETALRSAYRILPNRPAQVGSFQPGDDVVIRDERHRVVGLDPGNKEFVETQNADTGEPGRFPTYQAAFSAADYGALQTAGVHPLDLRLMQLAKGYDRSWNNPAIREGQLRYLPDPDAAQGRYDALSTIFGAEAPTAVKGPSMQYKAVHQELTDARKNLANRKQDLAEKRADLQETIQDDTPDLFGDRKPAGSLFDERADASRMDAALERHRADVTNAEAEVKRLEEKLKGLEGSTDAELFDAPPAAVEAFPKREQPGERLVPEESRLLSTQERTVAADMLRDFGIDVGPSWADLAIKPDLTFSDILNRWGVGSGNAEAQKERREATIEELNKQYKAANRSEKKIIGEQIEDLQSEVSRISYAVEAEQMGFQQDALEYVLSRMKEKGWTDFAPHVVDDVSESILPYLLDGHMVEPHYQKPPLQEIDDLVAEYIAGHGPVTPLHEQNLPAPADGQVQFKTPGGKVLTGERLVIPGFEDLDTVMVSDGLEKKVYEQASGLEIASTKGGFSEAEVVPQVRDQLLAKGFNAERIYQKLYNNEKNKQWATRDKPYGVENDSPNYAAYREKVEAAEAARPDLYSAEEKAGINALLAEYQGTGDGTEAKLIPSLRDAKFREKGFGKKSLDDFRAMLERSVERKRLDDLRARDEPWPAEKIDLMDDSREAFNKAAAPTYKRKDPLAALDPALVERAFKAWQKRQAFRNKYGYVPSFVGDGLTMALYGHVGDANGKEGRRQLAPESAKELDAEIEKLETAYRKEFGDTPAPDKLQFARTDDQLKTAFAELDDLLDDFSKGAGQLNSGMDPAQAGKLLKILAQLAKIGYYKLRDMAKFLVEKGMNHVLPYLKDAYRRLRESPELSHEVKTSLDGESAIERTDVESIAGELAPEPGKPGVGGSTATAADRAEGRSGGSRRPPIRIADAENIPAPGKEFVVDGHYDIDEHQRLGANLALSRFDSGGQGFLLADGAGVGKTREILVTAEEFRKNLLQPGESILLVSLANVLQDSYVKDAQALNIPLSNFDTATYTDLSAGKVAQKQYGLVVWDESHNLKNPLSQKSAAANSLKTRHELFASATPMDQPQHAVYFLSKITDKTPEQIQDELGLHIAYVESPFGGVMPVGKLDVSYLTYLERLIDLRGGAIKQGAMIRREYPFFGTVESKDYTMPANLAAEVQIVQETHQNRIDKADHIINGGRKQSGLPPLDGSELKDAVEKFVKEERRAEVNNVQKLSEPAKAERVFDEAMRDLSEGRRIVITAENVATAKVAIGKPGSKYHYNREGIESAFDILGKKFAEAGIPVARIYGGNNAAKTLYTEQQNLFQEGHAPVLFMTAKSGGTGINLDDVVGDAPRSLYKMTPNYSGDIFEQVLGRVSRRNTQSPAKVKVMYYLNNVSDDSRRQKVQQKVAIIRGIANGTSDIDTDRIQARNEDLGTERPTRPQKPKTIEFEDHEAGKSFFVKGNHYPIRETIKSLGGKWNKFTKNWMFPKTKEEAVKAEIAKAYAAYEAGGATFKAPRKKVDIDYDTKAYGSTEKKDAALLKMRKGLSGWHEKFRLAGENLNLASKHGIDLSGLSAGLDMIRPRTFADDFAEQKIASHIGYPVKSIADLADVFAVYRSPHVEKSHVVYLKDGQIVLNQADSRNNPVNTPVADPRAVLQTARKVGADRVMILHNHPSGNPEPSQADIEFTKWYGDIFEDSGVSFDGHVVMNGDRYALLDGAGEHNFHPYQTPQPILIKDRYQLPTDRAGLLQEMVKVAYHLLKNTDAHTGVVYIDSEGRVSGYDLVDKKASPVAVRDVVRRGINPNGAAAYYLVGDAFNDHFDAVVMPAGGAGQVALQGGVRRFKLVEQDAGGGLQASGAGGGVPPGGPVPPSGAPGAGAPGGQPHGAPEVSLDKKDRLEAFAKKVKGKAIEYFTVGGGIDKLAREAKEREIGQFNEWKVKARHRLQAFQKAVKEEYKKLEPSTREAADRALKGDNAALGKLQPKTAEAVRGMRDFIDGLTKEMIAEGVIPKADLVEQQIKAAELAGLEKGVLDQLHEKLALAQRIEGNLGRYVNRAYLMHRIRDWRDRVPKEKVQKAANYLFDQALLQGKTLSAEQLKEMVDDLLSYRTMDGLMTQSKMEMSLGILKKLKDIPEPLRDVMGQVKDAEWNFMNTSVKMANLLERHKFLTNLADAGAGTLFSPIKDAALNHTERINNFTWGALHGRWAEPELVAQLKLWDKEEGDNSVIMSSLRQVNSWAKAAKTTLSVASEMRNMLGNVTLTLFNGNFAPQHYVKGFQAIKEIFDANESPEAQAFIEKMNRLRVVGSSLPYYEIKGIMNDLTSAIPDAINWNEWNIERVLRVLGGFKDKVGEVYGATDDIYKIMTFVQERSRLADAYRASHTVKTDEQIDTEAADIATRILPTFSKVPKFVRYFSLNFPLVGTFVSYPTELLRSTFESVRLSTEQLRSPNPEIRKMGAKRLAWQIGVAAALPYLASAAGAALLAALTGSQVPEEEEKDALLEFLPDFYKGVNSTIVRKNGKYYVWMQNSFDGQSWLREIVNGAVKGDDASLTESLKTFLKPYASGSMPVDKLVQWVKNRDQYERPIYNEADDGGEKAAKAGKHFGDLVVPQTFYDVKKPIEQFGKGEVTKGELGVLKFLSGQTILQLDPEEAFKWKMKDLDGEAKELQKKASSDRYKAQADEAKMNEINSRLEAGMNELNEKRNRVSQAYERLIKD